MSETQPPRRQRITESLVEHLSSHDDTPEHVVMQAEAADLMVQTYIRLQECQCDAHMATLELLLMTSVVTPEAAMGVMRTLIACLGKVEINLNKAQAKADMIDPKLRAEMRAAVADLSFG